MKKMALLLAVLISSVSQATSLVCQVRTNPDLLWLIDFDEKGAWLETPKYGKRYIKWNSVSANKLSSYDEEDGVKTGYFLNRINGTFIIDYNIGEVKMDCRLKEEVKRKF
jgi:hypothetical protein